MPVGAGKPRMNDTPAHQVLPEIANAAPLPEFRTLIADTRRSVAQNGEQRSGQVILADRNACAHRDRGGGPGQIRQQIVACSGAAF